MDVALITLIFNYSAYYGIDPHLALAVIKTESGFKSNAIGLSGEIGLFQLRPKYFTSYIKKDLFNPKTNIQLGIKHLAAAKRECKHQKNNSYVVCYNMGIEGAKRLKHPEKFKYYSKVMENLKKFKYGDVVTIKHLFGPSVDGEGTYLSECKEPLFKNYHRILNEYGHIMNIEHERLLHIKTDK